MTPALDHVRLATTADGVTTVTLDRPPVNALDERFIDELAAVAAHLSSAEGRARVVVLDSAQKAFMVGADLTMMDGGWDKVRLLIKGFQTAVNAWEAIPSPTIAVIGGHALGAGCELALACDWRLMARGRATIGLPEVRRGLIAAGGGTQRMARIVGRAAALDLCVRGRMVDADTAQGLGLVSEAHDPDDLPGAVDALVQELLALPPLTVAAVKRCILEGSDTHLLAGLAVEEREMVAVGETEDAKEGVRSFLEKREPRFTGR
ncbi:MAG TPA: enoyl-CoA hydratase/isomerase family protein [Iamia sp.]|nr:enoyl-CoA hydratase/isomerase family protein [Iamia sp.]